MSALPCQNATRAAPRPGDCVPRTLQFGNVPLLMGIINVTPDSFSDGGQVSRLRKRPSITPCDWSPKGPTCWTSAARAPGPMPNRSSAEEELQRVAAGDRALVPASDSSPLDRHPKAAVATSRFRGRRGNHQRRHRPHRRPRYAPLAAGRLRRVCMHMQGTPQTMQDDPHYGDVVAEISDLSRRAARERCVAAGIDPERICLDPGIGFGKTHQHNLTLMAHCSRFHELGRPLLGGPFPQGVSRQGLGDKEADRTPPRPAPPSRGVQGVQVIRVHDVRPGARGDAGIRGLRRRRWPGEPASG